MKASIFFVVFLCSALFLQGQSHFIVIAKSGLTVRAEPDLKGQRIGKLEYLSTVEVIEKTSFQLTIKDEGKEINGHWVRVQLEEAKEGYVFDGFLKEKKETFELIKPNREALRIAWGSDMEINSLGYLYLKENYIPITGKTDLEYEEWDLENPCSFSENFENGIKYSVTHCGEEGGMDEDLVFPLMELDAVKRFINDLFYDEQNVWSSDYHYAPDGVGCHYEIIQSEENTTISIYCGC